MQILILTIEMTSYRVCQR